MEVNKLEVVQLLEYLQEIINNAAKVPMSGKIMISKKEIMEVTEEIINLLPEEFRKAQWMLGEKDRILSEAEAHAEELRRDKIEYIKNEVENHDIVNDAKKVAEEIIAKAQLEAKEIRIGSREYSAEIIEELNAAIASKKEEYLSVIEIESKKFRDKVNNMLNSTSVELRENIKELKGTSSNVTK